MINLLPDNEKMTILKEYHLRVTVVSLAALLTVAAIAFLLLFPSFVLSISKERAANTLFSTTPSVSSDETHAAITERISRVKALMLVLKPEPEKRKPTDFISIILSDKPANVQMTSFVYGKTDKGAMMHISGVAGTRESLAAYVSALRAKSSITKVNLPVSDLAKETAIDFSLDLEGVL